MTWASDREGAPAGGTEDRLLPWRRVEDIAGISRSTAWRLQQSGAFPSPVPVSPGRVAWWESELTAWKAARVRSQPLRKPLRPAQRPTVEKTPLRPPEPKSVVFEQEAAPVTVKVQSRRRRYVSPDQTDFGF